MSLQPSVSSRHIDFGFTKPRNGLCAQDELHPSQEYSTGLFESSTIWKGLRFKFVLFSAISSSAPMCLDEQ